MRRCIPLALLAVLSAVSVSAGEAVEAKNKALVARFYEEVWNKGDYDVADEVFAEDYVRNDPRGGNPPKGPRGQKVIAESFRKGCPDCVMAVARLIAEGDLVVGQWKITGTQQPSGSKIEFVGVNIFRFADGKVVEVWNYRDDLAYSLQRGWVTRVDEQTQKPAH